MDPKVPTTDCKSIEQLTDGQVIAIDGKQSRAQLFRQKAIHMSAWASENKVVLGQLKTNDKNEITAIPQLLDLSSGCIVTIDAMAAKQRSPKRLSTKKGIIFWQ
ncbi:MAG: ISAs1 family transposase [Chloroflexota bacterium]